MLNAMKTASTRVAILANSEKVQQQLSDLLEGVGLNVVARHRPSNDFHSLLTSTSPDVILVDLHEINDSETDLIDTLLDYDQLPVLFNDSSPAGGGSTVLWAKNLARKLAGMAVEHASASTTSEIQTASSQTTSLPAPEVTQDTPHKASTKPEDAAINFWLLGASLGGPQAVRQFLAAIEDDLPVAFILVQHIGANHISLLAEQLNRITPFKVLTGRPGYLLRHHEVVLAPADKAISITADGYLSLSAPSPKTIYSPSIDNAMVTVAQHYGHMAGAIIFSGMGDDGAKGCKTIAENGGIVWAQDDASCVIGSMPNQARKTNTVTYSANPRSLAENLCRHYNNDGAN